MVARRCIVVLGLAIEFAWSAWAVGGGSQAWAASRFDDGAEHLAILEPAFSTAVRAAAPAVVRIEVVSDGGRTSSASGVVIDTLGNVVTSADAVAPSAAVRVVLADGRALAARVRGVDPHSGVAVVQARGATRDFAAARFADSDLVEIGEWVLTISRPSSGGAEAVGKSLVSGRGRERRASPVSAAVGGREWFITEVPAAADGPGAPLVNLDGEVVALSLGARGQRLPINRVRRVAQMIIASGEARYPYIGVLLLDADDLDPRERAALGADASWQGAVVSRVLVGAPAARAGLRAGDVIVTIDNLETRAAGEVLDRVSDHDVGERVTIGFVRGGQRCSVQVGVDALPAPASLSAWVSPRVRTSWVISAGAASRMGGPQ